jgi:hypothetical protein
MQAHGRSRLDEVTLVGAREVTGRAYAFRFPFYLHIAEEPFEPQVSFVGGARITIYPPFLAADESPEDQRILPARIPHRPGTLPPDYDKVGFKSITTSYGLGVATNALRLDIHPDRGAEFATQILRQYIGLARWWSGQWWITRDDGHARDYLRNWFDVNEMGERLSGINGSASLFGLYRIERPLSQEHLQNIRGNITNGRSIPLAWDTLFDAIYFQAGGQLRRAVLEAAIACEAKVWDTAERAAASRNISKSRLKRAMSSDDFTVKLNQGIAALVDRRFAQEHPEHAATLGHLRTVRGAIAHGREPQCVGPGGPVSLENQHATAMIQSVIFAMQWLDGVV